MIIDMSLYCFGKIKLAASHKDTFTFPADVVILGEVDDDDIESLKVNKNLTGEGRYFSICDDFNSKDATRLWIEAMSKQPKHVIDSHFGKAVYSLVFDSRITTGAIAFVDGGIETVLEGSAEQCWAWFLARIGNLGTQSIIRC